MNIEELRDFCLSLPLVQERFPFDQVTLVFYIVNKMFCLTNIENFKSINLKCDPDLALELRANYNAVEPGYHMNKKHWNTVYVNQDVKNNDIKKWIKGHYPIKCVS